MNDSAMIVSDTYSLTRTEMARLTAEEYIRRFWYIAGIVPVFGLGLLIFSSGAMQVFGMICVLWPFSIPARAVIVSTKSSRLFTASCHVEATPEEISFIGEYKDGKRLRYKVDTDRLKQVIRRKGLIILWSRTFGFIPVKESAFKSEKEVEAFVTLVEDAIASWQADVAAEDPTSTPPSTPNDIKPDPKANHDEAVG